ncbi:MAG: type IV pilus assembly protein PilM [bacterium]|nr:type IV pilus assembly protein PilM [bacterium]
MSKIYTGLDIGTKSVKLVQLKRGRVPAFAGMTPPRRRGSVQLIHLANAELAPAIPASAGMTRPVVIPATAGIHPDFIIQTIQRLLTEQKIRVPHLVTAIPKHLTTVRSITLPTNSSAEIEQMIRFEAAKHIPFLAEDDILDFQIMGTSPIGGSQILLVAVRRAIIDDHLALLKKIGVEPEIISVSSVAIYTAMNHSGQLEEGAVQVLIDIGASMTDLTLIKNRILVYSRSATVAGNQLIQRLQKEFQIDEMTAASLLPFIDLTQPNFGIDTYHQDRLAQAILPWLELLDNEIKQSLEYFKSESGVAQIDSIILSGGVSRLNGLSAHLAKELNIEIIPADPLKNLDSRLRGNDVIPAKAGIVPRINVAVGLALHGAETVPGAGINLLPAALLRKRKQTVQQKNYLAVGALAGVLLLTGGVAGYREYAERLARIQEIKLKLHASSPLALKLKEMQTQVERIKGMFSPDDTAIDSLSSLSQFDFIPAQVAIIRFDYKRNTLLTMEGAAMSLPDTIALREALAKSERFELVKLRETRTGQMEGKPVQFFTIECRLNRK